MGITIRQPTAADKEFIITAITEAEKSGTDVLTYCAIFGISEAELRVLLGNILDEDMEGQELYIPGFLIAEADGHPAAAVNAWVEKAGGMSSSIIKSNLFMYHTSTEILMKAIPAMTLVNELNIERAANALQVESIYTVPAYRGLGLARQLILKHIAARQAEGIVFDKVQVMLMGDNAHAIRAYEKAGFTEIARKTSSNPAITSLLPANTKIMMQRTIEQ